MPHRPRNARCAKQRQALLAFCLGALTACGMGLPGHDYVYPNDRYLEENVAAWNSMITTTHEWDDSPFANEFHAALARGDDLSRYHFRLNLAYEEAVSRRASAERWRHRSDADGLHRALLASLQSTADMFAAMVALAELPNGYTAGQATPLAARMEQAALRMHADAMTLSDAQDAFAKAHGIQLYSRDSTDH